MAPGRAVRRWISLAAVIVAAGVAASAIFLHDRIESRLRQFSYDRRLGVREVWVWRRAEIAVFALRGDRYEPIPRSEILPQIDLSLVRSLLDAPTQLAAVRQLRARLRARE